MDMTGALKLRRKRKKKKPVFRRQEGYRLKKLGGSWRKPKGRHSKLRQKEKPRGMHPGPGYGSPRSVAGLGRSGLKEVMISTPAQISKLDPKKEAVLISGSVGKAKRALIIGQAKKLGVRVTNA